MGTKADVVPESQDIGLMLDSGVWGARSPWLVAGPFRPEEEPEPESLLKMNLLYDTEEGKDYWRLGESEMAVRPSFEQPLFGRWNYPVGVTLYGLLRTGTMLKRPDIIEYAVSHIMQCVDYADYSVWEMERYGFAAVNNQLARLEMLDDCGSFGLAMLKAAEISEENRIRVKPVADRIADYILHRQERRDDGAFYRNRKGTLSENTMWADDLFMSTPFLAHYARLYGSGEAMDTAAAQFPLFTKYLYMKSKQLMSHIYAFHYDTPTCVPWGRGNGWVLFSAAEVLCAMPDDHPGRSALMSIFLELSMGYLRCQGEDGLWHQVLDKADSYEESSCTSMFIYAFSTGVKNGWYGKDTDLYRSSAEKGWQGLCRYAIDRKGNVYGVCQGSGYSFLKEYYKNELHPITNDTHGIGIVMLAACAVDLLEAEQK